MRRLILPGLIALGLIAVVGVYALGAPGQRPMSGQIELWGGPNGSTCAPNVNRIALEGTGTMAHLGQVEIVATNCTGGELLSSDVAISGGNATYAAADGSTISVTYEGSQKVPVGAISAYTTTHTVTGGTGRFARASGTWTVAGTVDISIGRLLGDVSGWLSY